ncbi:MAG: tyrosine-protein phosphatase [Anaerolineales bacterium]|nr:tyrosine-protein phosphatase [Anaerolineales bacterium]
MMKQAIELDTPEFTQKTKPQGLLSFSGAKNFRDLGGYGSGDGRLVRWGLLYRSGALHKLTEADQKKLAGLNLGRIFDFRAEHETEKKSDRLPPELHARLVLLPMEDASTKVWHEARDEMVKNMLTLDPAEYMLRTNVELATKFTPQYRRFFYELLAVNGSPILFHCAAGKDRTGFAAACILKILGVPFETIMQDYLLTNRHFLDAYQWSLFTASLLKGRKFADGIRGFMRADERYLSAAFDALEKEHGSFEAYVRDGLELSEGDVERLRNIYLE